MRGSFWNEATWSAPRALKRGMTIVEITVVLMIVSIVAAVAMPRVADAQVRYRLDAAAKRIAADIDLARRQATSKSTTQTIQFLPRPGGNQYSLLNLAALDNPAATYVVHLSETRYQATLTGASFGGDSVLIFNCFGAPDSGGTVTLQAGAYTKTITVNATTGKCTVL